MLGDDVMVGGGVCASWFSVRLVGGGSLYVEEEQQEQETEAGAAGNGADKPTTTARWSGEPQTETENNHTIEEETKGTLRS